MKKLIPFLLIIFFVFENCKRKDEIEKFELEQYILVADSISDVFSKTYNTSLEGIYKISEDSILADSIAKLVILPKKVLFYELLQINISRIEDINYNTRQEIYFAQDQLLGLKEEVIKRQISPIQYELQLESALGMLNLLKERVDSSIQIMNEISEFYFINQTDSI